MRAGRHTHQLSPLPPVTSRELFAHLKRYRGSAAMRELTASLIERGVPLNRTFVDRSAAKSAAASGAAEDRIEHEVRRFCTSGEYSLGLVPDVVLSAMTRELSQVAGGPDAPLTLPQVRAALGPVGARFFELAADRAHAQIWRTSADRELPKMPANLRGNVSESPRDYLVAVDGLTNARPNMGLLRLADPNEYQRQTEQCAERLRRRNPIRRIAAELALMSPGQPPPPPKMAALDALRAEAEKTKPLSGAKLLAVQHLYESTRSVLDAAVAAGVRPDDVTVLGKSYSGSMKSAARMVRSGYHVVASSLVQNEYDDHDEHMEKLVGTEIERLLAEPGDGPILVVDDGGAVASYIARHCDEKTQKRFRLVEQTQRGANAVRDSSVKAPVMNVAESEAKKDYESPMIGHSVYLTTKAALDRLRAQGVTLGGEMTFFGFGAVGAHVAEQFQSLPASERPQMFMYDPDPAKQALARQMGVHVCASKEEALSHAHVCVSATGREPFKLADYAQLPQTAVLVNAASANAEVDAKQALSLQVYAGNDVIGLPYIRGNKVAYSLDLLNRFDTAVLDEDDHLWDTVQGKPVDLGHDVSSTHIDRVVHTREGQDLYFVNSGFVVNLTEDEDPIPPRYIGLTRALLFEGLLEAMEAQGDGLIELNLERQRRIVKLTQDELAQTGESLLTPSF